MQTITSLIVCIYCGHSRWWSQDRYNKVAATTVAPLIVFQICKLTVFACICHLVNCTIHTTSSQVEGDLGVSWIFNTWLLLKMEKTHEWKRSYLRTYSFWDAHTVRKHISVTLPCFSQAFHVCWHLLYIIAISLHFSFVKISLWSSILPQQHLACFRRLQSIASQRPSLHQRPPAKNADIIGNLSGN